MTTTQFKDFFGNEISREEAEVSTQYSVETFVDGVINKIEQLENGVVEITYYHLDASESINELLLLYPDQKVSFSTITDIGSYRIEYVFLYEKGRLTEQKKWIMNKNDQYICLQKFDTITGLLINNATEKYYKDETSSYTFEYDQSGNCFMIHNETDGEKDIFGWEIGNPRCSFTWNSFEYYQYSEPLLPE
ncbi:hypothetical protein DRF65_05650 [Chryseobacterium pennae]|uniref:Uncharacterized protein n=1 Tax=Chryseobacterium pennae TaxID=2258962 RepID=A0A3D9CD76_9FLAO|nr:hypothetical protein [Chryseobacterium pennae]REC63576.1 hypothetical protein DRF65_05650 [Chryseobacterium pennae]